MPSTPPNHYPNFSTHTTFPVSFFVIFPLAFLEFFVPVYPRHGIVIAITMDWPNKYGKGKKTIKRPIFVVTQLLAIGAFGEVVSWQLANESSFIKFVVRQPDIIISCRFCQGQHWVYASNFSLSEFVSHILIPGSDYFHFKYILL